MAPVQTEKPQLADIVLAQDRDEAYTRLLDGPPVTPARYVDGTDVWLVTRYGDIVTVLTDRRFSNDPSKQFSLDPAAAAGLPDDIAPYFMSTFGVNDPPVHTRLRRLVTKEFTSKRVQQLRPRIQEITGELLEGMAGTDEIDLIERFALPLPLRVICELLGVPAKDQEYWHNWANDVAGPNPDRSRLINGARGLVGYISELIAAKRATEEDLLSALIRTHDVDGDRLSREELISVSITILLAGYETTANLIGNGTLLLLSHPDQLNRLRADPDQIPVAVEELLRYGGPSELGVMRFTLEPVELGGVTIPANEPVQVVYATGNRDRLRFGDPDRLQLDRTDNAHLTFGNGIHFCLGAALARAEGDVAFRSLIARFPDLALAVPADQITWRPGFIRSVGSLPVRLGPVR